MSANFDSIVMEAMKNRDTNISTIDALKKQITPYATKKELKEVFDEIIKKDPDYIRRYLNASSNIVYQTDVVIDSLETKQSMLYRNIFNNDSIYLNFGNGDKILVVCSDSSLASDNHDFYSDVFVNGVKLRKKNYIEMPSDKVYNFKSGARRFLIDEDKVNVGDIISIVIRKEPRSNSFYTTLTIENVNCKTYTIRKQDVGRYGEVLDTDEDVAVLENLLVFKKSATELDEQYFQLDTKAFVKEYIPFVESLNIKGTVNKTKNGEIPTKDVKKDDAYKVTVAGTYGNFTCKVGDILFALESLEVSDNNNWGWIPSNYRNLLILDLNDDVLTKGDTYLVINRMKHIECEFNNTTELTDEEYIAYDANKYISLPLVDKSVTVAGCNLPLPVKSINDVEVYVNGYRLINDKDFIFVNDKDTNQYIQFTGILQPNSIVTYRNKHIEDSYNFYTKYDLEEINDYVAFNEDFQNLIYTDVIPNNTEVVILGTIKCILYKDMYSTYRYNNSVDMFKTVYRIVKYTDEVKEYLDNSASKYEEIVLDGIYGILCDEALTKDIPIFEYLNEDRYLDFDAYVRSLVESGKIELDGIKSFDSVLFTKYTEEYNAVKDQLVFLDKSSVETNFSYGIIDLDEYSLPVSEDYIEAYLGRVRVPLCNKRSIINRYLKLDDQHTTFNDVELYSEINWSDYAKTVINMIRSGEIEKNVYTQLKDIDTNNEITDTWLSLTNDIKINTDEDTDNIQNDIFYGKFNRISISTTNVSDQKIKQNVYPIFRVLAYYDDENYIDVTSHCNFIFKNEDGDTLNGFDTMTIGKQYVTAVFSQGSVGNLISDTIVMEVVEIELESIQIVSSNNIFTVDDNLLDYIRVIGHYENGSERVITDKCTISISNYDATMFYNNGKVTSEGSYVVTARYSDRIYDIKTVLVSPASDKRIKSLDVIPTSMLADGEIVTTLDIYATFNNNQIQKVSNETVNIYVFRDGVLDNHPSNANNITGLALNADHTLRIYIYNNDSKTGDPIETLTGDYIDVTIRLLNNSIKSNHQIIHYDNLTATLDDEFVNTYRDDQDYYYYSIKNLNGIYMSIGQGVISDVEGAMTIDCLTKNEVVLVEFYNRYTNEFVKQLLFTVMDADDSNIVGTGTLSGNMMDGYIVSIDLLTLNEEYENIDFKNAILKDSNDNIIVSYNTDLVSANNNFIELVGQYIHIHFKNFKTNSGNVHEINKYIDNSIKAGKISLGLYFTINSIGKTVELHVPDYLSFEDGEFKYFKYYSASINKVYIDNDEYEDEYWLMIDPVLPDCEIVDIYEVRPELSHVSDITSNGTEIGIQLKDNNSFDSTLSILRAGLNRYYYRTIDDRIYVVDTVIVNNNGVSTISSINGSEIELTE